jgi:hypothetical protein
MSLRGFHIVFVALTTLLSVFMTAWAILWAPADAGYLKPCLMIVGIGGCIVFPIYGVFFYRKAKNLII